VGQYAQANVTADAGRPASPDPDPSAPVAAGTSGPEQPIAPTVAAPDGNGQEPASTPVAPPDAAANGSAATEPEPDTTYEPAVLRPPPGDPLDLEQAHGKSGGGKRRKPITRVVIEWIVVLAAARGAALLVQAFVLKAFFIPSGSMRPTLQVNDRVLVNKLSYRFGDVQRGDLIVFHKPDDAPASDVNDFIKRVIAIEGDEIEDRDGTVYVNGQPVDEPYLPDDAFTTGIRPQTIPEDHVFVMGDNRNFSVDSRVFGPIPEDSIIGEAILRVWPPSDLGRI
jgi:signal peptidase I